MEKGEARWMSLPDVVEVRRDFRGKDKEGGEEEEGRQGGWRGDESKDRRLFQAPLSSASPFAPSPSSPTVGIYPSASLARLRSLSIVVVVVSTKRTTRRRIGLC